MSGSLNSIGVQATSRLRRQSPLVRYCERGQLGSDEAENARLFQAAQRYIALCERARVGDSGGVPTQRWSPRISGGSASGALKAEETIISFHNAKERLGVIDQKLGICYANGLKSVLIYGMTAEHWAEKEGERRSGSGLSMLRIGLRHLSDIFSSTK